MLVTMIVLVQKCSRSCCIHSILLYYSNAKVLYSVAATVKDLYVAAYPSISAEPLVSGHCNLRRSYESLFHVGVSVLMKETLPPIYLAIVAMSF